MTIPQRKQRMVLCMLAVVSFFLFSGLLHAAAPSGETAAPTEQGPQKAPATKTKETQTKEPKTTETKTTETQTDSVSEEEKAEEPLAGYGEKESSLEMPMGDSYSAIQSLMALCFVLGMIFVAAYFFKKVTGMKTPGLGRNRVRIDMLGNMPLGEKKFLSIVQVQDKNYFLGITENSINLLSELELDLPVSAENEDGQGFESLFKKARALLNRNK